MEIALNCKPGIVINAISIRKTMFDYISRCKHFLFATSVKIICFNVLLILQKQVFENFNKAKNFSSLKFSICLIQRELPHGQTRLVSNANEGVWYIYCITDMTASDKP